MKPFRITGLEAHQIGPFGELRMTFPEKPAGMEGKAEIHILTGENGVGKTTVLEMLAFMGGSGGDVSLRFRKSDNNYIRVYSSDGQLNTISGYNSKNGSKADWEYSDTINERTILFNNKAPLSLAFFAYSGYRSVSQVTPQVAKELDEYPLDGANNFFEPSDPSVLLQWISNNIAKEAIAQRQNDGSSAQRYRSALSALEETISKIIDGEVKFYIEIEPFEVLIEVNQERLDFNLLPDGLKSIVSWLADLLMRMDRVKWANDTPVFERNFILFLDEIEVHIHPKWQRKLLPAVQSLFPNAQIFISTHSPFVVGSVDGAWVHQLVKPNGDSVPDGEPFLSEDGKSVLHILEEVFGVTEQFGPGVERDLKQFYALRDEVLNGKNGGQTETFLNTGRGLADQSTELRHIIEMEIRQVNHRKKLNLSL